MFNDKKVVVVMPAYNAAETLVTTHREVMAQGIVDLVIVVECGVRNANLLDRHRLVETQTALF